MNSNYGHIVNNSDADLIYVFFQDTKVFGGTVPRGHGNDGLLTDLKRLLDEAEDLEEDFDEVIRRPSQRRPQPQVSLAVEFPKLEWQK
jgi:hypothetical protein